MVFSSVMFLFIFLPLTLLAYFALPKALRNFVLLIASLFFYAWGEPRNVFLMLLSILLNYCFGFLVEKDKQYRKGFLFLSIVYNLAMLFVFKYWNFTMDTIGLIFNKEINYKAIALPIGISFYTFQIMSYVIDVYKGKARVQRNILDLALYIALFPQLIAGPIVRYVDVEQQIHNRTITLSSFKSGVVRFMIGFSKKVFFADQLSIVVERAFNLSEQTGYLKWIGAIAYALQIYYDFSGYSDMAIGLGKMFGFTFLENFNYPYISQSIQEFWRRWHISLSSWFRDYVYIPLGGNRKGKVRTYVNLFTVFLLTGLWHGASFNFIVWGLYYGLILIAERIGLAKIISKWPRIIRHFYTLILVLFGWIIFRANTLSEAIAYMQSMFIFQEGSWASMLQIVNKQQFFLMFMAILFSIPYTRIMDVIKKNELSIFIFDMVIGIIFVLAISYLVSSGYSPFLYFRF
ncbi:MAG: MBOAT family protein [Solobacterium sp.]|nr:MBOAT family protein [Solobacterium sp.]